VDPISSYLGRAKMADEQAVRNVLNPLVALAEKTGICVLVIMHLNKKIDLDAVNRVGGAMAFVGIPRLAWIFAKRKKEESEDEDDEPGTQESRDEDNTIYMMKLKGNIVKAGSNGLTFVTDAKKIQIEEGEDYIPFVRWTGTTERMMDDLSTKKKPKRMGPTPEKRIEVRQWLTTFLADGPKPLTGADGIHTHAKQLLNVSDRTVERAGGELGVVPEHSRMRIPSVSKKKNSLSFLIGPPSEPAH